MPAASAASAPRAVGDEIVGDDVGLERDAGGRAGIGQLLVDDRVEAEVEAGPAIGSGTVGQSRPASPALVQKARSMIPSSSQRSRWGISSRSKKR
jgi:hypothetical protein